MPAITIFENQNCLATFFPRQTILVVENKRKEFGKAGRGKYLTHGEAETWREHIESAIDPSESAALCRAILNS